MCPTDQRPPAAEPEPPGFRVQRDLPPGRHPILKVFPGLDRLPTAERLVAETASRERLFRETAIDLVAEDLWMYVAPHALPPGARRQWRPVLTAPGTDCIVVGEGHLR